MKMPFRKRKEMSTKDLEIWCDLHNICWVKISTAAGKRWMAWDFTDDKRPHILAKETSFLKCLKVAHFCVTGRDWEPFE